MTTRAPEANTSGRKSLGFAALGWTAALGLASFESFDALWAMAKLAAAGGVLAAVGRAVAAALRLRRESPLSIARDILLGQLAGLAYVYLRSLLSDTTGLPGLSFVECYALAAALCFGVRLRWPDRSPRFEVSATSIAIAVLWLAWLGGVAFQKLDLHYTPSSDPDIHAFYTRVLLERGQIYHDLLPRSDAWMVYPSAFMSSNFLWSTLSGLHPVQIVNVAVYVQWTLFAGASFACLASARRRASTTLWLALAHFAFVYFGFNAAFAEGRDFLEGTPRLAHTALLIHPLLLAIEHRDALRARPGLWGLPAFALAVGACVNPTHVPLVLLSGMAALVVVAPKERRLVPLYIALGIGVAVAWTDPFYRGFIQQRTAPTAEARAEPDLTGRAFGGAIDLERAADRGVPQLWKRWWASDVEGPAPRWGRRIAGALAIVTFLWIWRRDRGEISCEAHSRAAFGSLMILSFTHALWTAITPALATPGVLQSRLLVQYSRALQEQLELMALGLLPMVALSLWLARSKPEPTGRALPALAAGSLLVVAFVLAPGMKGAWAVLRSSPLGEVSAGDVAFAREVVSRLEGEERILLPGRTVRAPDEHWIFTVDAGRAVPLFTDARTSFFLGLDGASFTADHYVRHVAPPRFDRQWLRDHRVVWLFESGQFPKPFLDRHYELVERGERAALWRLRPTGVDARQSGRASASGVGDARRRRIQGLSNS